MATLDETGSLCSVSVGRVRWEKKPGSAGGGFAVDLVNVSQSVKHFIKL